MTRSVALITIKDHSRQMIETINQISDPRLSKIGPRGYMLILVAIAPIITTIVASHLR